MKKKVLVVAYHFPPSNAVGALRPAKFAEYLPEFGWEPVVLTAPSEGSGGTWQFAGVPDVPRETVRPWPGLRQLAQALVSRRRKDADGDEAAVSAAAAEAGWRATYEGNGRRSPVKDLLYSLMWLPDDRQGWIGAATIRGLELIRRERPDALLVTSPPHSAQVVGLLLSRLAGLPLLADFRDPWGGNPGTPEFIRSGPTPRVHEFLEAQALHAATFVIAATSEHARALAACARTAPKVRHVANGFDPALFQGLDVGPDDPDRFTITYAGNFYHTRTPAPLFEALQILARDYGIPPERFRVVLVGECDYAGTASVREMARARGCEAALDLPGRVPHRDALARLVRSDLLLLLASDQPAQIPAKAYEYLAAGPPILALVEPGATAELLRNGVDADVLLAADPREIAAALRRRLVDRTPREAGPWRPPPGARPYDRRTATARLAALLDEAVAT